MDIEKTIKLYLNLIKRGKYDFTFALERHSVEESAQF
jgi:hypothetical protein